MANLPPDFKVRKQLNLDSLVTSFAHEIPTLNVEGVPVLRTGPTPVRGDLAYEPVEDTIYYANGVIWQPIYGGHSNVCKAASLGASGVLGAGGAQNILLTSAGAANGAAVLTSVGITFTPATGVFNISKAGVYHLDATMTYSGSSAGEPHTITVVGSATPYVFSWEDSTPLITGQGIINRNWSTLVRCNAASTIAVTFTTPPQNGNNIVASEVCVQQVV